MKYSQHEDLKRNFKTMSFAHVRTTALVNSAAVAVYTKPVQDKALQHCNRYWEGDHNP